VTAAWARSAVAGAGLCRIRSGADEVRKLFLGPAFDEQGDEVAYPCIGELSSYRGDDVVHRVFGNVGMIHHQAIDRRADEPILFL
jgi:hypothetical protein